MKIGIVVYSKTGQTFNIARKIEAQLNSLNIETKILRLQAEGNIAPRSNDVTIVNPPSLDEYDAVIFGLPVWAFTASPVLPAYLRQPLDLKGKKVLTYATMGFPMPFLGGNKTLIRVNSLLLKQNAVVKPGEIFNRKTILNELKVNEIVKRIVDKIK